MLKVRKMFSFILKQTPSAINGMFRQLYPGPIVVLVLNLSKVLPNYTTQQPTLHYSAKTNTLEENKHYTGSYFHSLSLPYQQVVDPSCYQGLNLSRSSQDLDLLALKQNKNRFEIFVQVNFYTESTIVREVEVGSVG